MSALLCFLYGPFSFYLHSTLYTYAATIPSASWTYSLLSLVLESSQPLSLLLVSLLSASCLSFLLMGSNRTHVRPSQLCSLCLLPSPSLFSSSCHFVVSFFILNICLWYLFQIISNLFCSTASAFKPHPLCYVQFVRFLALSLSFFLFFCQF